MSVERPRHPVRIVVADEGGRSRLTVFFRLLLAIPHLLWTALIGTAVLIGVFVNWWIVLVRGRTPDGLHDFIAGFLRYATHVEAYVLLAADPYPGFYPFDEKPYPVDLEIDPPARQSRWKTFFRLFLALPAILIEGTLLGGGPRTGTSVVAGLAFTCAFLMWWVALFRGRVPRGMRDLVRYCIGYAAQLSAYLFLVTDRYPYTGPNAFVGSGAAVGGSAGEGRSAAGDEAAPPPAIGDEGSGEPPHTVGMTVADDLRRSRVLVLFRLPIAIPHFLWWLGWSLLVLPASIVTWFGALVLGRPPRPLHRFLSAYVRYTTHLNAFFFLVGNPFPGFLGKLGTYPVELRLPEAPEDQKRLVVFFRFLLAIPALMIGGSVWGALSVASLLAWFVALVRGRMPDGIRNLGGYTLRYAGQTNAYLLVLTARYPDSGPRPDPASP